MKVLLKSHGTPTDELPLGTPGDGVPVLIEAALSADETRVRVRGEDHEAVEGDEPGQFVRLSRIDSGGLRALRAAIVGLCAELDPTVSTMAKVVRASITGIGAKAQAATLLTSAENRNLSGVTRSLAILALGLLLAEERDR